MTVMESAEPHSNLARIQGEPHRFSRPDHFNPLSGEQQKTADLIAEKCYLSHGRTANVFADICRSDKIASAAAIGLTRDGSAESILGTEDAVFLYAAPFRYPSSTCGFLFNCRLETVRVSEGTATPFDSGALVKHLKRQDMSESPRTFFERHRLPLKEYRSILRKHLELFERPNHYLEEEDCLANHPFELQGGDMRSWTFELQIEKEVFIRDYHSLEAVFINGDRVSDTAVSHYLRDCRYRDIKIINIGSSQDTTAFDRLKNSCIDYFRETLLR